MRTLKILLLLSFSLTNIFASSAESNLVLPKPDYTRIEMTLQYLSKNIGPRPAGSDQDSQAIQYISQELKNIGYSPVYQDYRLPDYRICRTVDAFIGTTQREIILATQVDTSPDSQNIHEAGSGIAILLELARLIRNSHIPVGVHFLFLGAEEKVNDYDEGRFFSSSVFMDYQRTLGLNFLNGVIIIDKIGSGDKFQVLQIDSTKSDLTNQLVGLAARLNVPLEKKVINRFQESMPFEDAGLPTAYLEWTSDTNLNPDKNIADKTSRKKIESILTLLENFILAP